MQLRKQLARPVVYSGTMNQTQLSPKIHLFSPSRYVHYSIKNGNFRYYYAYGNTRPEDFLQHLPSRDTSSSQPLQIMALGCGDIRSCLYTLWKNFDPIFGSNRFPRAIHFTLNDYCPAVLARNVLFLYLMTKLPDTMSDSDKTKELICAIWAIWYSLQLQPQHRSLLMESLRALLSFSKTRQSWKDSPNNPLNNIVSFESEETLEEIYATWKLWLNFSLPLENAMGLMKELHKRQRNLFHTKVKLTNALEMLEYGKDEHECRKIEKEFDDYTESGQCFAEEAFKFNISKKFDVNPTLFETEEVYTLHYTSVPYSCYFHGLVFSNEYLKEILPTEKIRSIITVDGMSFKTCPVLANCVQQFTIWLTSASACLNSHLSSVDPNISFNIQCGDAIQFACSLLGCNRHFDLIHSSNIVDPLSVPAVVLSATPLLNSDGLLMTTSFVSHQAFSDTKGEFIEKEFGIPSEHIPTLCGIRCIGKDGKYSSHVSIGSHPPWCQLKSKYLPLEIDTENLMIWEKIDKTIPLVLSSLNDSQLLTNSLFNAIKTATTLLHKTNSIKMIGLCSYTGIMILQSFVSQLDSSVPIHDYHFWEALSSLLRTDPCLKPYLMHIQTQTDLSGLHLHLTVTCDDCPICQGIPVAIYYSVASVHVTVKDFFDPPFLTLLLYPSYRDYSFHDLKNFTFPPDVHIIDSSQGKLLKDENVEFLLILPNHLFSSDFKFAVIATKLMRKSNTASYEHVLLTNEILLNHKGSSKNPLPLYHQPLDRKPPTISEFGHVTKYFEEELSFISTVKLTDEVLFCLESGSKINPTLTTPTSITLSCGTYNIQLTFHGPINFSSVKLQLSRKRKIIDITAPRMKYLIYNERALYRTSCSNKLILPTIATSEEYLQKCCAYQITDTEVNIVDLCQEDNEKIAQEKKLVEYRAKDNIAQIFFQVEKTLFGFMETNAPKGRLLIIVNRRLFDIEKHSPAVDISFSFNIDSEINSRINYQVIQRTSRENERSINKLTSSLDLPELRNILSYYKDRATEQKPSSQYLKGLGFERAVIYPLYAEADQLSHLAPQHEITIPSDLPSNTTTKNNKCNYCHSPKGSSLLKCSRCRNAWYCNKDCQKKDWKQHKKTCTSI